MPIPAVQMSTENKQVSVLFVDVCESTAMLQDADPEQAREYLGQALDLLVEAVRSFGGTVSQLLGDGLVALFGAPVAQEDHALRACLAALKIQRSGLPEDRSSGLADPKFRIGINSGEVLVGIVGQYQWSHYGADGKTIHLASRLEKMASPGGILISAATQRLIAQQIDTRPVGLRTVRGLDDPIELHEVVVDTESSAAAPLTRQHHWAPLVGRDVLLQALEQALDEVRHGAMRMIGLRGDAGVGKSRLVAEWTDGLLRQGVQVCLNRARRHGSTAAYSTAAELAANLLGLARPGDTEARRSLAETLSANWPADGSEHLPAVVDLLGLAAPDPSWLSLAPAQKRRRIGEALLWIIRRRIEAGPLVLVLEDAFLADRESQRLLESLIPRLYGLPVLICVSYRQDCDHRWDAGAWFKEYVVGPLGAEAMTALARALLGRDASLQTIIDALVRRADGNPFFIEQMIITLIDDGSLEGTPGAYRLKKRFGELRVPGSIAAVISARVDRLPPPAKSSLEAAGILGDPITAELIGAMQSISVDRARELLRLCVSSGLLAIAGHAGSSAGDNGFIFRHALVRDVVVGTLPRARLKALHRVAFLTLQAQAGADDPDAASALANHAFRGEEWHDAAKYAVKSMARAVSHSANQDALRMFELGIEASCRAQSHPLELSLRLEATGAMMALGQIDEILRNMERAESLATELNDQRARASVASQTALFLWMRGQFEQGLQHASRGLEAARLAQRRHMIMAAHQTRLMHLHALGRYAEAAAEGRTLSAECAPELAQHYVQPGWAAIPIVNLYAFHASTLWRLGDCETAQTMCEEAYAILSKIDHPYSRLLADSVQAQLWLEQEAFDRVEELMRSAAQRCVTHNVPTMSAVCLATLGNAMARNRKAAEAAALLEQAFADRVLEAAGPYGPTLMRVALGIAYRRLGRFDDAIRIGCEAVEQSGEEYGNRTEALFELAETLRCAGDARRADDCFAQSEAAAERLGMIHYQKRAAAAIAVRNDVRRRA